MMMNPIVATTSTPVDLSIDSQMNALNFVSQNIGALYAMSDFLTPSIPPPELPESHPLKVVLTPEDQKNKRLVGYPQMDKSRNETLELELYLESDDAYALYNWVGTDEYFIADEHNQKFSLVYSDTIAPIEEDYLFFCHQGTNYAVPVEDMQSIFKLSEEGVFRKVGEKEDEPATTRYILHLAHEAYYQ